MDMDRYIGRLLDNRYEILEVIGSGGMSVVYKARCHRLNRLVAIKILKDENLQDEDFRRRFHAESQAVAMLSHPNIVSVYDVSNNADRDYIVMELIDGITLKQYMEKKGVLNWKETLHFAIQIAKALEHAHSRGLVHRDIKPHNVMVLKNGSVKVADFGIARIMSQSNTLTKEALGSVHYISPEQAKGGRVDNRSDIYSLGVVMYEMITGRPPYDGESPVSVAIQHINGGASRPSALNPNTPKGLEQIIMKAMDRDLRKRYPTATAMLYDMDEFRKDPDKVLGLPVPAADEDAATRVVAADSVQTSQIKPEEPGKKTPQQQSARRQEVARQRQAKAESTRSNVATIAVVACSVVAMIAIVIFMLILIDGSGNTTTQGPVKIPYVIGSYYDDLPNYRGVEIIALEKREYSDEYEAGQIIRQEPSANQTKPYGTKVFVTVSLGKEPDPIRMPDLEGQKLDAAQKLLDGLEVDLEIKLKPVFNSTVPADCIISTDPAEGTKLLDGQIVTLTVSKGTKKAIMPDLSKYPLWNKNGAEGQLENLGFENVEWIPVNSQLPAGRIISQSVPAGKEIEVNAYILVEYSNGIPPVEPEPSGPDAPTGPSTDPVDPPEVPEEKTILYRLSELPAMQEDFTITVIMNWEVVVEGYPVPAGQTFVDLELTGYGIQECVIYINEEEYKTVTVDFEANG